MAQVLPQVTLALGRSNAQEGKNEWERGNTTGSDGGMLHASLGCANALAPHSPCYGSESGLHLDIVRGDEESVIAGEESGCGDERNDLNGVENALGSHPATLP